MADTRDALLVPMKEETLVIDDEVLKLSVETIDEGTKRVLPNTGKWTPRGSDVRTAFMNLAAPGPAPWPQAKPRVCSAFARLAPPARRRRCRMGWRHI